MSSARNYTIDDSQWSTPFLALSAGWNMLRVDGANEYINQTQVDAMVPLLGNFWNSSLSWTTTPGANTTVMFVGSDIWAYGVAGPEQGPFSVTLDNATIGDFSAAADTTDYHRLLFGTHGLDDGPLHYLTLTNRGNTSLAFDVAYVQSAVAFSRSSIASDTPPSASASASSAEAPAIAASSDQPTSPLTTSAAAANLSALLPTQYSAAQLASLTEAYHFKWNGAAYFLVVFGSLVAAALLVFLLYIWRRAHARRSDKGISGGWGRPASRRAGESYLVSEGKTRGRPTTRVLEALKGKQISHPMPSDDGHSIGDSQRPTSHGTDVSYMHEPDDRAQGW